MKHLFLFCAVTLLLSCHEQERNCTAFKTGEYEFEYTIDGVKQTGRFVRNENYNIDFYEGKIDTSSVRWINDCEFIVKKINPQSNSEKDAIHMKILSTNGSESYTFEYKLAVKKPNRTVRVEKGIAYKIN